MVLSGKKKVDLGGRIHNFVRTKFGFPIFFSHGGINFLTCWNFLSCCQKKRKKQPKNTSGTPKKARKRWNIYFYWVTWSAEAPFAYFYNVLLTSKKWIWAPRPSQNSRTEHFALWRAACSKFVTFEVPWKVFGSQGECALSVFPFARPWSRTVILKLPHSLILLVYRIGSIVEPCHTQKPMFY